MSQLRAIELEEQHILMLEENPENTILPQQIVNDIRAELEALWEVHNQHLPVDQQMIATERMQAILSHVEDLQSEAETNLESYRAMLGTAKDLCTQRDYLARRLQTLWINLTDQQIVDRLTSMLKIDYDFEQPRAKRLAEWICGKSPWHVSTYYDHDMRELLTWIDESIVDQISEHPEIEDFHQSIADEDEDNES